MRVIALIAAGLALATPALANGLEPGIYRCRTPAGTETGSSFVMGENGRYGDNPASIDGTTDISGGEIRFDGAGNDGKIARVISDTRVKIGKHIFCQREAPLPKPPQPEPQAESQPEQQAARPEPKLIVVKPDLRR